MKKERQLNKQIQRIEDKIIGMSFINCLKGLLCRYYLTQVCPYLCYWTISEIKHYSLLGNLSMPDFIYYQYSLGKLS